jgi:hypothetical protein
MEIDREIEPFGAKPPAERDVAEPSADAASARRDDHLVQMRVVHDDWRGGGLDQVREMGAGEMVAQGVNRWCREGDVADLSQADQQDS